MDNITAINMLKMRNMGVCLPDEVYETAIKALEEIQPYHSIGTIEECREAVEIQKKKKPNLITPCKSVNYYQCPVCGELVSMNENFCSRCGQALYWED